MTIAIFFLMPLCFALGALSALLGGLMFIKMARPGAKPRAGLKEASAPPQAQTAAKILREYLTGGEGR